MQLGFGPELEVVDMATDSSVAKSFVSTRGLGKRKHLDVKLLWLQECVQRGLLNVAKVSGATNVADALTKYQDVKNLRSLWQPHGVEGGPAGEDRRAEGGCEQRDPRDVLHCARRGVKHAVEGCIGLCTTLRSEGAACASHERDSPIPMARTRNKLWGLPGRDRRDHGQT